MLIISICDTCIPRHSAIYPAHLPASVFSRTACTCARHVANYGTEPESSDRTRVYIYLWVGGGGEGLEATFDGTMSALIAIVGLQNFGMIMNYYRYFKNLAMKIVFTVLQFTWKALKFFVLEVLPYPCRCLNSICFSPAYNFCCRPGSPIYYCKENALGCCDRCRAYYNPYDRMNVV